jgi:hypothetical protein
MWSALADLMCNYNQQLRKKQAEREKLVASMTPEQREVYTEAYNKSLLEYEQKHEEIRRKRDEQQALQKEREALLRDLEDPNSEHFDPLLAKRIRNNEEERAAHSTYSKTSKYKREYF